MKKLIDAVYAFVLRQAQHRLLDRYAFAKADLVTLQTPNKYCDH
ncbi:hypothetical protein ACFO3O_18060 [Dokdonia ponticola]|uniref:Uncharacterized protein n=1 Tax=Dokdonia ponticola TaxID=2041041 RepID=A0ABV9I2B2_9FLAO